MGNIGLPEALALPFILVVILVPFAVFAWLCMRIVSKAGFPAWLGIAGAIPLLNFVLLCYLAFAEWPIHRQTTTRS